MPQVQRAVAHTGGHLDLVAVTAPEMVSLLVVPTSGPWSGTSTARHRDTGTGVGMSPTVCRKDVGSYKEARTAYSVGTGIQDLGVGYSMLLPYLCSVGQVDLR